MKKVIVLAALLIGTVSCEKNYRYCITCNEINPPAWVTHPYKFCDIDKKSAETSKKNHEHGMPVTDGPNNETRIAYYTCEISTYNK